MCLLFKPGHYYNSTSIKNRFTYLHCAFVAICLLSLHIGHVPPFGKGGSTFATMLLSIVVASDRTDIVGVERTGESIVFEFVAVAGVHGVLNDSWTVKVAALDPSDVPKAESASVTGCRSL